MWECDYAREPINYRLFFLKLLKKIWILPLAAVIGAVVIGGIYYVVKVVAGDGYKYKARTMYYVQYSTDSNGESADYYNYYTWEELLNTDYFVDGMYDAMGGSLTKEYITANVTATLESDYRYMYTNSISADKQQAIEMEKKVSALILQYADMRDEFEFIEVIDPADESTIEDVSLIFVGHSAVVGAVIGFIASLLIFVFIECTDTSVYLPATLEKRYHIVALGAPSMKEFDANCEHILKGKKAAVVAVDADMPDSLIKEFPEGCDVTSCGNPIDNPEELTTIRDKECVVLAVKAAAHNGKKVERMIEQLSRQDIKITAFVLYGEDKWLINRYYR